MGLVVINGQQVRSWVRDGLLADLGSDPRMATVLARVPDQYHLTGAGEASAAAIPLAVTRGIHATGLYYNKAILDAAGLEVPRTFADLEAAVQPLAALGVAPLVHCSGDVQWNQMFINGLTPIRQGGDSGGPWYFGNQAWGLIKGRCDPNFHNFESFTVADLLDEALGVRVACGCSSKRLI
jgi:ABC-type glycerol-3-phosphate transport system substrate-binding protein